MGVYHRYIRNVWHAKETLDHTYIASRIRYPTTPTKKQIYEEADLILSCLPARVGNILRGAFHTHHTHPQAPCPFSSFSFFRAEKQRVTPVRHPTPSTPRHPRSPRTGSPNQRSPSRTRCPRAPTPRRGPRPMQAPARAALAGRCGARRPPP